MRHLLPIAMLTMLAACSPEHAPDAKAPARPATVDQPAKDVAPATAPAVQPPSVETAERGIAGDGAELAHFDGYGDLRLGMPAEQMEKAWGGELKRIGAAADACYFLSPKWARTPAEFAFMVEGGKFVRYGSDSQKYLAPGGGAVGMSDEQIRVLYEGRVREQPHKYVPGGHYLRIQDATARSALVFETDAKGNVTKWRAGLPPQVDYVEGCS